MSQVQIRRQITLLTLVRQMIFVSEAVDQSLEALAASASRRGHDGATIEAWNAFQELGRALVHAEVAVADAARAWGETDLHSKAGTPLEVSPWRLLERAAGLHP